MSVHFLPASFEVDTAETARLDQLFDARRREERAESLRSHILAARGRSAIEAEVSRVISPEETRRAWSDGGSRAVRPEARRSERRPVWISRALVSLHGKPGKHPVSIVDLSHEGCLLRAGLALAVGERLWIELAGGERRSAEVKWAARDLAGCQFDQLVDAPLMQRLVLPEI